jgi:hypothetical protein
MMRGDAPTAEVLMVFVILPDRGEMTGPAPAPRLCCIASQRQIHAQVLPATVPNVCYISIR